MKYLALVLLLSPIVAMAEDTEQMIRDGIALHDQQKYGEAIELYERVLELEPDNVLAGYELAFAHQANGDLDNCIKVAESTFEQSRDAEADDYVLASLYGMLASCHSAGGATDIALGVFEEGLEQYPDNYDLHFNIAITFAKRQQFDESVEHLQRAAELDPSRSSPFYYLGSIYYETRLDPLAILAYTAFLHREFNSERTVTASRWTFETILRRKPEQEDDKQVLVLNTDLNDIADGLSALDLALSISAMTVFEGDEIKEPVADTLAEALASNLKLAAEIEVSLDEESFINAYLLGIARELYAAGVTDSFARYVASTAGAPGAQQWIDEHPAEMDQLVEYLNSGR